jgi:tripartite ATP-independent transporter DctP family solute receptor
MKKFVSLLICAAVIAFALKGQIVFAASGKTYTIRMAHTGSEASMMHLAYEIMKDYMEKNSDGALKVELFPNGQLGNDSVMVESTQNGDLQMIGINNGYLSQFLPKLSIFATPFIFKTQDVAYKVLDGEFGQKMLNDLEHDCGLVGLGYIDSFAYRQLTANKPVYSPADLVGVKIRVMPNPIHLAIWESLGANPSPIPFSELYTALQQKTVDAQENPLENIITARLFEVQKYVILTNHVFTTGMVIANPKFYNSLSPELQKIVRDSAKVAGKFQREKGTELYESYVKTLKDNGIEIITLSPEQLKLFEEQTKPALALITKEAGQELVDLLYKSVEEAIQ